MTPFFATLNGKRGILEAAPGIRTRLIPLAVTIYRGGEVVRLASGFRVLAVLSTDARDEPRALVHFSLN